ncbi:MAG: YraN family protein [Tissierellia bacterium]|nr:YraN family protein [Tissierellia bacterium]
MKNKMIGKLGEQIAVDYLVKNSYIILERNYSNSKGEIDIIAFKDKKIIVVEVKTRKNDDFAFASESVNYKKIRNIKTVANDYIFRNGLFEYNIRFDIIECYWELKEIRHIKNAF